MRYQATKYHLYSLKPEEIIRTVYLSLPFISHRNSNKGSGLNFLLPPVFSLLIRTCVPYMALCGVPCLALLGAVSVLNFIFQSLSCISSVGTSDWSSHERTDHGHILMVESTGFPGGWDMETEKKSRPGWIQGFWPEQVDGGSWNLVRYGRLHMETVRGKVEEQEWSFGLVNFNISNRHPTEEIK